MHEVIGNLKNKIILNEKTILDLKNYIYKKHPNSTPKELSLILADGIHRIINNNMAGFLEIQRDEIERSLIRDAVSRNDFSISGYKVFCQYCKLSLENESNISILQEWLNAIQERPIKKDELVGFIHVLKSYKELPIEEAINNAAESVNEKSGSSYMNKTEGSNSQICCPHIESNTGVIENKIIKEKYILIEFIIDFAHRIINVFKSYKGKGIIITASIIIMFFILLNAKEIVYAFKSTLGTYKSQTTIDTLKEDVLLEKANEEEDNGLPKDLQYIEIDKDLLKNWLKKKDSILAEEPYLSSILDTAKEYNINPLFMIAITGQEQGFVPKSHENALEIANNPFNVYGSWIGYNTNINDSSKIAAQTIINLSKGRPDETHVIQWINEKYAEDKNWWVGVDKIFNKLKQEIKNKKDFFDE